MRDLYLTVNNRTIWPDIAHCQSLPMARIWSTATAYNRLQSVALPSISISPASYRMHVSPLAMLDREAREHKPRQYLLLCGRLSRQKLGMHDSGK